MRIRKRVPFSSLSSVPLSDPQLNQSPVLQEHHLQNNLQLHPNGNLRAQAGITDSQPSDPPNQPLPLPSHQQTMIGSEKTKRIFSDSSDGVLKMIKQKELEGEKVKQERWREEEIKSSNDTRRGSILGATIADTGVMAPSGSHQVVERWFEGDKVILPLKKRRGSFVGRVGEETMLVKEKKMKAKMKSKTNKKCVQQNSDEQEEKESKLESNANSSGKHVKKINKRGSVIMEGSRCSRVNGRGWRCCQQTLVGYSLCEHHLGKGRLRSMTSVRSRAMANTTTIAPQEDIPLSISSTLVQSKQDEKLILLDDSYDEDDYDDEKEPLLVRKKKRMKLGMVKARSISSLLNQTNNAVVVADDSKKGN